MCIEFAGAVHVNVISLLLSKDAAKFVTGSGWGLVELCTELEIFNAPLLFTPMIEIK